MVDVKGLKSLLALLGRILVKSFRDDRVCRRGLTRFVLQQVVHFAAAVAL
jgi:hypothetical protein